MDGEEKLVGMRHGEIARRQLATVSLRGGLILWKSPIWANENRAHRLRYPSDLTGDEWAHVGQFGRTFIFTSLAQFGTRPQVMKQDFGFKREQLSAPIKSPGTKYAYDSGNNSGNSKGLGYDSGNNSGNTKG